MYVIKENKKFSRNFYPSKQKLFSKSFPKNKSLKLDMDPIDHKDEKLLEKIEESCEEPLNEYNLFETRLNHDPNYLTNRNSTISTTQDSLSNLDVNKEIIPSTFKRKSNFYKNNDGIIKNIDMLLDNLSNEFNDLIQNNIREIAGLNKSYFTKLIVMMKDQSDIYLNNFRERLDERLIKERNSKEELNLLQIKLTNLETSHIHREEHQKMIDDLNFTCEMQKRIYSEKMKYYHTLLEEVNERENVANVSNFDNTILNFTNSSIQDKSVFLVTNQENSVERRKITEVIYFMNQEAIYNSFVFKENGVIGRIANFNPKFLSK